MKIKAVTIISLVLSNAVLYAADPGGTPGLLKAVFTGSTFNSDGDVRANALGYTIYPEEMYATSLGTRTTVAWAGYMKMEAKVTYNFKGCYDDYATVKINGNWIVAKGGDCLEVTGSFTPETTDWYAIEFRVGNNGGAGGIQNASTQYGILWNTSKNAAWRKVIDSGTGSLFKTGTSALSQILPTQVIPVVISSQMRPDNLTIMDISYIVLSPKETANVRALAFQDGERSFWKVIRPKSFVKDPNGNPTIGNIGDGIPANVVHNLAWRVPNDWGVDLAKVMFEVLVSDQAQLPLKMIKITATAHYPELTVACNTQTDTDMFNAFLWYYACEDPYLVNNDGYVDNTNGVRMVNRTGIDGNQRMEMKRWMYEKMGWEPVYGGPLLNFIRYATRQELWFNSGAQNCYIRKGSAPETLYIGEKAYCIIDLSGGTEAESYPISYQDYAPLQGWSDEYKTTKLVLRRITEGKFMMQNNKQVTLTKPYYIGVYPVTKKQYDLVMGTANANGANDKEPIVISWNDARGDSATYNWPTIKTVDETKFIGKIRARAGIDLDLPTEAQWEFAARSSLSTTYPNGGGGDVDRAMYCNRASMYQVGQFYDNFWGVYDVTGNVGEWCLDWAVDWTTDPSVDYLGGATGTERMIRGLTSEANGNYGTSCYSRESYSPTTSSYRHKHWSVISTLCYCGIRLSVTILK